MFGKLSLGSTKTQLYLKVGFKIKKAEELKPHSDDVDQTPLTDQSLVPPSYWSELYKKIYDHFLGLGFTTEELKTQIIIPGFIFKNSHNGEMAIIRPGLEPIPKSSEGWKLADDSQDATLSGKQFALFLSEGKLPLEPKMFRHDISHILDEVQFPEVAPFKKMYFRALYDAYENGPLKGDLSSGQKSFIFARGSYLNEFLFLPRAKALRAMRAFQPEELKTPVTSVDDRITLLKSLPSKVLRKYALKIYHNRYRILDFYGGGSGDGDSLRKFSYGSIVGAEARNLGVRMSSRESIPSVLTYLTQESLYGLLHQIKDYATALEEPQHPMRQVPTEKIEATLINTLAKFEYKIAQGINHKMSIPKFFQDISVPDRFSTTETYRYFAETAEPNSLEDWIFLKGNLLKTPDI